MAVFVYDVAQEAILKGNIDLSDTTADLFKAMLVLTTSNAATRDKATIANVGNITNIAASAARTSLTGITCADLAAGNITKWDSSLDVAFATVSEASQILACIIYKFVTNDAGSTPIVFLDGSIFPITTTGDTITVKFNASGILQATAQSG